jgi:transcription initiation factor IIE alpha subunit
MARGEYQQVDPRGRRKIQGRKHNKQHYICARCKEPKSDYGRRYQSMQVCQKCFKEMR